MKWEQFKDWLLKWGFTMLSGFVIGLVAGNVMTASSVVNDCKVMKSFRINATAFNCEVK